MDYAAIKYLCSHVGVVMNPVLSNLLVYERPDGARRMQVQNGRYAVDAPTDLPELLISAEKAAAVWSACPKEPITTLGEKFLTVTSGRIRARIALLDPGQYPRVEPTEKSAHSATGLLDVLRALLPYVAEDASRPWATSICVTPTHAYATNNVIIARAAVDVGVTQPINIPGGSIEAILAAGNLLAIGADDRAVTFYLEGDIWVRCQLVSGPWPTGTADELLGGVPVGGWLAVNPQLEAMLRVAAKLADTRHPVVVFKDSGILLEDDTLVVSELEPLPDGGKVNAKMAALVFEAATHVQWHVPRKDVHAFRTDVITGVFGGHR